MKTIDIKRGEAANLIEAVRQALLNKTPHSEIEKFLEEAYGIEPLLKCNGEAHTTPFIDNCGVCMPRWGISGSRIRVRLSSSIECFLGPIKGTQDMHMNEFEDAQELSAWLKDHADEEVEISSFRGSIISVRFEKRRNEFIIRLGILANFFACDDLEKLLGYVDEHFKEMT